LADRRTELRTAKGANVKNRPIVLLLAAAGLVTASALAGCSSGDSNRLAPSSAPITTTAADNGKTVPLFSGQQFLVSLPANPSTGYSWNVTSLPSVLETAGVPSFVQNSTKKDPKAVVGAAGTVTLTFRAKSAGNGTLVLGYMRPWESVPPEQTYTLHVEVK
jgi:inhibitor of cysteine peptidase